MSNLIQKLQKCLPQFVTNNYHSHHSHPEPYYDDLIFFVNGEKQTIPKPPSSSTPLAYYLRDTGKTSVKIGCEEGGCGACTVIGQFFGSSGKEVRNMSINSCLAPVCSVQGMNIITLEGLQENGTMNSIMDAFVERNATQCGFCTPGFEMAIFAFLTSQIDQSKSIEEREAELEIALSGNLCRCTGYRPILDACRDVLEDLEDEELDGMFPEELFEEFFRMPKLFSCEDKTTWYHFNDLMDLVYMKKHLIENGSNAAIINGGTELILESNLLGRELDHLLYAKNIPELNFMGLIDEGMKMRIGSSVSLSEIEEFCEENLEENKVFKPILHQLRLFAGRHIRNVASIGGNIVNASPTSDLNPVWLALNCTLNILNSEGEMRVVPIKDFFKSYRTVDIEKDEVLTSIDIPLLAETSEIVQAFKQSKRREDDIAIQNACMRIRFNKSGMIEDSDFAYGCMAPIPAFATHLPTFLEGKEFTDEVFTRSLDMIEKDFPLIDNAPGGMVEYRKSLVLSFYYKFYLKCRNEIYNDLSKRELSILEEDHSELGRGTQHFEEFSKGTSVGQAKNHIYGKPQVTGEANYVDDIPKFPNELHGAFVVSEIPKGKIKEIKLDEALEIKGVKGWIDHNDVPGDNLFGVAVLDEEIMASEDVHTCGQIIGMIVADSNTTARKASKKVKIVYEEDVDSILSIDAAIKKESFFDFKPTIRKGDVEKGFEDCENVKEGTLYCGGQEHFYLEPQACIVYPKEENHYDIITSSQNVHATQHDVAIVMGIPQNRINVKTKRLGGGFGGKESRSAIYCSVGAVAAKKFGAPVRIILDRHMDMMNSGQRHAFKCDYKVGYDNDGKIKSIKADLFCNAGYSTDLSGPVMERAVMLFDNFYDIENLLINGYICQTNLPSNTAMRGFGGPQGLYFTEHIMHEVAKNCNIHPSTLRKSHFYQFDKESGTNYPLTPFGAELYNCECQRVWDYAYEKFDIEKREKEVEEFNAANQHKKRGIGTIPIKFGISFAQTFLNKGISLVHVYKDGSVLVSHGGVEMGQGLHTKVAQVAATTLGIPMEKVNIIETCTDKTANASPTSASCGSDLNSAATRIACKKIITDLEPLMEEKGYLEGKCTWEELISAAYFQRISLTGHGYYSTPGLVNMDWETGQGNPFAYYTYSTATTEVEIDGLTGDCKVLQSDIVFDCGESLNPKIDIGQIEGAFVQGLGWVLTEELVFGSEEYYPWVKPGTLQSKGPGFYKIPTANDIPTDLNVHLLPNSQNPFAVLSSKGLGEPPLCLSLSAYFAVREAIGYYREENNVENRDDFTLFIPSTAERIRMACVDDLSKKFQDENDDYVAKGSY